MKNMSVQIQLDSGLEARIVAMLVQVASKYDSKIYLEAEGKRVNAKSIMGMMSLGLNSGETLSISADGQDEDEAAVAMADYLTGKGA